MSALERHCGWLLHAYPAWYRRERAEEMLDTLLEVSPAGSRWPSFRDARSLVIGGLRVRGLLVSCLSMLWAVLGAAGAGYDFILSEHVPAAAPYDYVSYWVGEPTAIPEAALWGALAWLLLTFPVLVAGLVRLRRRWLPAGSSAAWWVAAWTGTWFAGIALMLFAALWGEPAWLLLIIPVLVAGLVQLGRRLLPAGSSAVGWAAAWTGAWLAGIALMIQILNWEPNAQAVYSGNCWAASGCVLAGYRHVVVSWRELAVVAGWLALGAAMTLILGRPTRRLASCVPAGMVTGT